MKKLMNSGSETKSLMAILLGAFKDSNNEINDLDVIFCLGELYGKNGMIRYDCKAQKAVIIINNNRLWDSSLEFAKTMLHEAFHAYICAGIYEDKNFERLTGDENFKIDYGKYKKEYLKKHPEEQLQHSFMATHYIEYMKNGLKEFFKEDEQRFKEHMEWDNNKLDNMYECLAWEGLKSTIDWANNPSSKLNNKTLGNFKKYLPKTCK